MELLPNPTAKNFRQAIMGFEVSHVIGAVLSSCILNTLLGVLGLVQWPSIALGLVVLVGLRIVTSGEKPGHLQFAALWATRPRLYLGHAYRPLKEGRK